MRSPLIPTSILNGLLLLLFPGFADSFSPLERAARQPGRYSAKFGISSCPTTKLVGPGAIFPSAVLAAAAAAGDFSSSDQASAAEPPPADAENVAGDDQVWQEWSSTNDVICPKLSVRPPLPEERGKGGVIASEAIKALETVARIPRSLVLSPVDAPTRALEAASRAKNFSWAVDLTAAALAALHPTAIDDELSDTANSATAAAKREWIRGWKSGGWATDSSDLGPPETDWGPKCVTGSLLSTGSDNDHNIYAKFRFPCHPTVHRAGLGLAMLTGCREEEALEALVHRGKWYRSMRDALLVLVDEPTAERKGSMRERRAWDVADTLSRVLSRAAVLELPAGGGGEEDRRGNANSFAVVVPLHERLNHCDGRGENTKLVAAATDDEVLLVATRDIEEGEEITRDYRSAPRLDGDNSKGALRLLLQFGLPPVAWETA